MSLSDDFTVIWVICTHFKNVHWAISSEMSLKHRTQSISISLPSEHNSIILFLWNIEDYHFSWQKIGKAKSIKLLCDIFNSEIMSEAWIICQNRNIRRSFKTFILSLYYFLKHVADAHNFQMLVGRPIFDYLVRSKGQFPFLVYKT